MLQPVSEIPQQGGSIGTATAIPEAVVDPQAFLLRRDQTGVGKDLEVLRHRRLSQPKCPWISHTHMTRCCSILRIFTRLGSERALMTLMKSFMGFPLEGVILSDRNIKDRRSAVKRILS